VTPAAGENNNTQLVADPTNPPVKGTSIQALGQQFAISLESKSLGYLSSTAASHTLYNRSCNSCFQQGIQHFHRQAAPLRSIAPSKHQSIRNS
jgi:hypothetical protein